MKRRSLVASVCALLAVLAAGLTSIGGLAAYNGWVAPLTGFYLFMPGVLLGVLGFLLSVPALFLTRAASGRGGRGAALTGFLLGGAVTLMLIFLVGPSRNLPAINDITTDPDDPPVFQAAGQHPPNQGRDLSYPGEEFAALQRNGYPDLAPIEVDAPPAETLERVVRSAESLGWTVVARDPAAGRVEAYDVTGIFRFVDDVVVRVRPADGGSRVDVRSKSRDGRGDLGANADRIRALRDALRDASG